MGTQNFSLSHARDKTKTSFLILYRAQNLSSPLFLSTDSSSLLKIELIEFDLKQTEKKVIGEEDIFGVIFLDSLSDT